MSDAERGEIMKAMCDLPDDKKQFVLGYAAGVASAHGDDRTIKSDKNEEKDDE